MKKILLFLFLPVVVQVSAQTDVPKRIAFGGFAGIDQQTLTSLPGFKHSEGDPILYFEPTSVGPLLGIFIRRALSPAWALRPELSVSRCRQSAMLYMDGHITGQVDYTFTNLELPVHLVATNQVGKLPIRGSILVGARAGVSLYKKNSDIGVAMLQQRIGLDLGLGLEFTVKHWKIQPEVVYTRGMNNIHDFTNAKYDWAVGRITSDHLALRVLVWRG